MTKEKTANYAIMRSVLGDYWVGKTFLKTNDTSIFPTFDEATGRAIEMTDSKENTEELESVFEEDCEIIRPEMEKWMI